MKKLIPQRFPFVSTLNFSWWREIFYYPTLKTDQFFFSEGASRTDVHALRGGDGRKARGRVPPRHGPQLVAPHPRVPARREGHVPDAQRHVALSQHGLCRRLEPSHGNLRLEKHLISSSILSN